LHGKDHNLPMTARAGQLISKVVILSLVIIPLAGTVLAMRLLWHRAVNWGDVALLIALYLPISMGITIGFHRYLTHRGFRTHPAVKAALLVLGSMALEGPAIAWAANHRKHHALSDRDGDPHSPLDGFFHAHVGWLFNGQVADTAVYARDLREDGLVVWISRLFPLWAVLAFVMPFLIGGWHGLVWGGLVRIFLTHHVTWSVNSVCHTFGSRPFRAPDRSRNQWLVGLLALGEGWHNNHHAFPRSALHGLRWWQFDLSGLTIRLLERLRLAWNVHRVSAAEIRARTARELPERVPSAEC
jgi:stearoyl-CoA desaturase (delta-9 desaturase)